MRKYQEPKIHRHGHARSVEPEAHIEIVSFAAPSDNNRRSKPRGSVWVSHIQPNGRLLRVPLSRWMRLDEGHYEKGMVLRVDVQARQYDSLDHPAFLVSQWVELTHRRSDMLHVGFGCEPNERTVETWRFSCTLTGVVVLPEPVLENFRDYSSPHRDFSLSDIS